MNTERKVTHKTMIAQLDGLIDTSVLSAWEERFVADVVVRTKDTPTNWILSAKQVTQIEILYRKHFA
jgi:hypothetical protein